jgi:RND family efflux transporter MFP subunit
MLLVAGGSGLLVATVLQARQASVAGAARKPAAATALAGERRVAAEGRVAAYPGSEVVVAAERTGRLVRVAVVEGQAVRRGELLAELESDELRATLREAEARVAEAQAQARLAAAELARRAQLVEQRILAAQDLDQARRDVEVAEAALLRAAATVSLYRAQLDKTRIAAPIAGTVVARHADAGEMVETGQSVATVAELDRLRVEAEADEADAGALAPGLPVEVTAQGWPGRSWRGTVEEIADAVTLRKLKPQDPARPADTRVVAVKVALAESTPLKLGTTVEVRIDARPE